MKKNVLLCISWKAEPERGDWAQMVYLGGDSKKQASGKGKNEIGKRKSQYRGAAPSLLPRAAGCYFTGAF